MAPQNEKLGETGARVKWEDTAIETRIPNFNTISTIIDRLTIESVKQVAFEKRLEDSESSDGTQQQKITQQKEIRERLREELEKELLIIFENGSYDYFKEIRTFG